MVNLNNPPKCKYSSACTYYTKRDPNCTNELTCTCTVRNYITQVATQQEPPKFKAPRKRKNHHKGAN